MQLALHIRVSVIYTIYKKIEHGDDKELYHRN